MLLTAIIGVIVYILGIGELIKNAPRKSLDMKIYIRKAETVNSETCSLIIKCSRTFMTVTEMSSYLNVCSPCDHYKYLYFGHLSEV